jgi:hypothetical protein
VNVDAPPPPGEGGSTCKRARYLRHSSNPCATCHKQLDAVGFGFEGFDRLGAFRTVEPGAPECPIDGSGVLDEKPFTGPAGLAQQILGNQLFAACAVKQVFRYAHGRSELESDAGLLRDLETRFTDSNRRLTRLFLGVVTHETFGYRTEEP